MKELQILMPMGGLGQRFKDAGFSTPKPLIDVNGTPMFQKALNAYSKYKGEESYIFVIRKDTDDEYGLARQIKELIPNAKIKILDHNTKGAVETCLVAEEIIDPDLPLVIMDCDISFDSDEYFSLITKSIQQNEYDALLLSFTSTDPRYSFAKTDSNNLVIETAEKVAISNKALMGAYFFTKAEYFLDAAHKLVHQEISEKMKEYYVSLIYNILITDGKRVGIAGGKFYCFGTPEELARYLDK